MALPIMLTNNQQVNSMQTLWSTQLNPVIMNPIVNGLQLTGISLVVGSNVVNHKLGRKLQGWIVTRMADGFTQLYDTQNSNRNPELTLTLNSSAAITVDLWVY